MDHQSLKNLLEEVQRIVPAHQVLLFGSSSLLATISSVSPEVLGVQLTVDADFFIDPDDVDLRQSLQERLGEDRPYHEATGYYGDFVNLHMTESFPDGWRDRLIPVSGFDHVFAFDPTDVVASKVGATASTRLNRRLGRSQIDRGMKDIHTVSALLRAKRLSIWRNSKSASGPWTGSPPSSWRRIMS